MYNNIIEKYLGEAKKDDEIRTGDKVRVNKGMVGGGAVGKVIELDDDMAIVKFSKKVKGVDSMRASYYVGDLTKI